MEEGCLSPFVAKNSQFGCEKGGGEKKKYH